MCHQTSKYYVHRIQVLVLEYRIQNTLQCIPLSACAQYMDGLCGCARFHQKACSRAPCKACSGTSPRPVGAPPARGLWARGGRADRRERRPRWWAGGVSQTYLLQPMGRGGVDVQGSTWEDDLGEGLCGCCLLGLLGLFTAIWWLPLVVCWYANPYQVDTLATRPNPSPRRRPHRTHAARGLTCRLSYSIVT
eukprot:COSAG02_NODE_1492_length_12334_cov_29.721945_9_plen_192_part_00